MTETAPDYAGFLRELTALSRKYGVVISGGAHLYEFDIYPINVDEAGEAFRYWSRYSQDEAEWTDDTAP